MGLAEHYDAVARDRTRFYQDASWLMRTFLHRPVEAQVDREVRERLAGVSSVADGGCGFGQYLLDGLDERVERVFLADLSEQMLASLADALRERFARVHVRTWCGDLAALPSPGERYDLVLSVGVLNHVRPDALGGVLDTLAGLAQHTVMLYYAHTRFVLSRTAGRSFRSRGIYWEAHERRVIESRLADRGFRLRRASYLYRVPFLSPLVMQTFERRHAG